ncbi:MAG: flagellar biosynthetic protein FliR [Rickettsiales bacterium]|nr:flagellar biosynthetic protein FliR [Rickettsiales bacterium]
MENTFQTSLLETFLIEELFAFLLIFTRVGAGIMTLPGFGENYVFSRFRLHTALAMSVLCVPLLQPYIPPVPTSPFSLLVLIVAEVLVGLFLGMLARLLMTTMHIAGSITAFMSSLSMATVFDPASGGQTTVISNFLTLTVVVLFFMMDMHHIMLNGLVDSYTLFIPGQFPVVGDMSNHAMQLLSKSFMVAVQLASPHIIFALMYYLASGVLVRLMPTMPVFFVLMPIQILTAFFLLLAVLTTYMIHYTSYVEAELRAFLEF